jgi:hypothetical protein
MERYSNPLPCQKPDYSFIPHWDHLHVLFTLSCSNTTLSVKMVILMSPQFEVSSFDHLFHSLHHHCQSDITAKKALGDVGYRPGLFGGRLNPGYDREKKKR